MLFAPVLPAYDELLRPCTILQDFLGNPLIEENKEPSPRIRVAEVINILHNGGSFVTKRLPEKALAIGVDEMTGNTIAWTLKTGNGGEAIFLGFRWVHAMREHDRMMTALMRHLAVTQKVTCSNPNLWTSLRSGNGKSLLFVMNLWTAPMAGEVSCRPAGKGAVNLGRLELGPMSVKVLPI